MPAAPALRLNPAIAVQRADRRGGSPQQSSLAIVKAVMRWAKLVLYLYMAQAAAGFAIGFALPFLSLG
jgi:hypothetical protein